MKTPRYPKAASVQVHAQVQPNQTLWRRKNTGHIQSSNTETGRNALERTCLRTDLILQPHSPICLWKRCTHRREIMSNETRTKTKRAAQRRRDSWEHRKKQGSSHGVQMLSAVPLGCHFLSTSSLLPLPTDVQLNSVDLIRWGYTSEEQAKERKKSNENKTLEEEKENREKKKE